MADNELEAEQQAIAMRQKIAEAMLARSQVPVDPGIEPRTRTPVPFALTQGLAQLAQAYLGREGLKKAASQTTELEKKRSDQEAKAFADYMEKRNGVTASPAVSRTFNTPEGPQQVGTEALMDKPADPMGAVIQAMTDRNAPPGLKQFGAMDFQAMQQDKTRADQREFLGAEAQANREARLEELKARLADARTNARDKNDIMRQIAEIRADSTADAAKEKISQKKEIAAAADEGTLRSSEADLDRLAEVANQLKTHPGLDGITGMRGKVWNVPGTDAADAQALLETLKSQVAFGVLQTMRNNSKTGGALGQVSDAEGRLLQANLAPLDKAQSKESMQKALDRIIKFTDESKTRLRNTYNSKYSAEPTAPPAKGPSADDPLGLR